MKLTWKNLLLAARNIFGYWALGIITLAIVLYLYTLPWTGFGDYTTITGDFVRGKTLWDWMELLIIPVFLAAGAIAVNRSEKQLEQQRIEERSKLEREIATDRQQEIALQAYIDRMSELLLKEKLRTTKNAEVRDVARTRTVSVMRGLDEKRNNIVIQFLREAGLILEKNSILIGANLEFVNLKMVNLQRVNLQGANLRGTNFWNVNLEGVNLKGAILEGANLMIANLEGASLEGANLTGVNLTVARLITANLVGADVTSSYLDSAILCGANLTGALLGQASLKFADLQDANLKGAYLDSAVLEHANLLGANLEGANLLDADVTEKQLAQTKSLKGATMPDGTKHE